MQYKYSSTVLCESGNPALGMAGPIGGKLNGSQVNDLAQFIRASAATFFPRGNRVTEIELPVLRSFSTEDDCARFMCDHMGSLPQQGNLVITYGDATTRTLFNAVLDGIAFSPQSGISVLVTYKFRGGVFSTDVAPGTTPGTDTLKRGVVALALNDESKAVAFDTAFATPPVVVVTIYRPAGGYVLTVDVDPATITTAGFTAVLGGPVLGSGYSLSWIAML